MNDKTGTHRGARRAAALAAMAAIAMLATACGTSSPSTTTSLSASSYSYPQELALAQCMRDHGLPTFPDPSASEGFSSSVLPMVDSSQGQAAYGDCRHLLAGGGPSISQLQQASQQIAQKEAQELPTLVKFSECMRSHGVPNYPDPTPTGQAIGGNLKAANINISAPQFQAAVSACQHLAPGLSFHSSSSRTKR
jgi:hypothetical protein